MTALVVATEVRLISYAGRLIDLLSEIPSEQVWRWHGSELMMAAPVMLLVPQFVRGGLDAIALQCNVATPVAGPCARLETVRRRVPGRSGGAHRKPAGRDRQDAVWLIFVRVGSLHDALSTITQPIDMPEVPDARTLVAGEGRITLSVEPGEKVALVGRSGAGKSTLVNLLLRFHALESGRIAIDGQDIGSVDQDSLRAAIGMVGQQTSLLHRSVSDNIAIGREDATPEQIEAAARAARANHFIADLEDVAGRRGYDTLVLSRDGVAGILTALYTFSWTAAAGKCLRNQS